ncbi:MAG: hypothetical protein WAW75_03265, partial [Gallionella sp.]
FVAAITYVSAPATIIISGLLALCASCLFEMPQKSGWVRPRVFLSVGAAVILYLLAAKTDAFSIRHTKTYSERSDLIYEKWSPLARVTVFPDVFWRRDPKLPFGWGMSPTYVSQRRINQLWIEQDACAGTPITEFSGNLEDVNFLRFDITAVAYHVWPETKKVFIIGPGGGRDVLTALNFGVPAVTACDINPVIVDLVENKFKDFAGDLYSRPGVTVHVGEGRSTIRRMEDRFDVILIPLIDSWAATTAGAFSLAENNLYTVEAMQDYLDHLEPNGCLSVTRFLFQPRNQTLRLAIIARRALEEQGVPAPEQQIVVIGTTTESGVATVLVKKQPFTPEELSRLHSASEYLQFPILFSPDSGGDSDFVAGLTQRPLENFLQNTYYDLSPSTDNRPFFFQMIPFSRAFDLLTSEKIVGQVYNYYAPLVLILLLALSTVLVLLFYILPLKFERGVEPLPKWWGTFAIVLGLGFMFVEIPLMQKGSLYLGHPTYSLTIVLFSLLIFAGLGSRWSGRNHNAPLVVMLRRYLIMAFGLVALLAIGSDFIIEATIGLSFWIRVAIFVVLIGTAGFFMGTAFPSAIRLVGNSHIKSIPWVWALNGGASVLGSILAMAVAMAFGYWLALAMGAVCYLFALAIAYKIPEARID